MPTDKTDLTALLEAVLAARDISLATIGRAADVRIEIIDEIARRAYDAGVADCIAALDLVEDDLPAGIKPRLAALVKGGK